MDFWRNQTGWRYKYWNKDRNGVQRMKSFMILTLEYEVQEEVPTMGHKQSEYLHNLDTKIVAGSTNYRNDNKLKLGIR